MKIIYIPIFKKISCSKYEIFDILVSELQANGWTLLSTSPETSGYVFYSQGGAGDKTLYFMMAPCPTGNGTISPTNDVRVEGNYSPHFWIRLLDGFDEITQTPYNLHSVGAVTSAAGAFVHIAPVRSAATSALLQRYSEAILDYYISVNPDRFILCVQVPDDNSDLSSWKSQSGITYCGIYEDCAGAETQHRGMVLFGTGCVGTHYGDREDEWTGAAWSPTSRYSTSYIDRIGYFSEGYYLISSAAEGYATPMTKYIKTDMGSVSETLSVPIVGSIFIVSPASGMGYRGRIFSLLSIGPGHSNVSNRTKLVNGNMEFRFLKPGMALGPTSNTSCDYYKAFQRGTIIRIK